MWLMGICKRYFSVREEERQKVVVGGGTSVHFQALSNLSGFERVVMWDRVFPRLKAIWGLA